MGKRGIEIDPENGEDANKSRLIKRARTMPEVSGKIACIEVENFMCHSTLKLNFDIDHYNCAYIVGANGSGKSALFASLNIGLGGTGRLNERGKAIKDYIKEGTDRALVRIHITNQGPNALPDYNDIIIVERQITENTSPIVLKTRSANGVREEIKTKKNVRHDLSLILQQFNIELDNPLSWLSQDRARQFLFSMRPDKLYELYRKSSELDSTENVYRDLDALYEELTKMMEKMDDEKKAKENKYLEKKARFDAVNMIKEKKIEKQKFHWLLLWAPVRDLQQDINEIEEKLEQNLAKIEEREKSRQDQTEQLEKVNRDQLKFEENRDKAAANCREQNERVNEIKRTIRQLTFDLNDAESVNKNKERKMRSIQKELDQARQRLTDLQGDSDRDVELEKNKMTEDLSKLAEQTESTSAERQTVVDEMKQVEGELQERKNSYESIYARQTALQRQKDNIQQQKMAIEQSKKNKLALFGQDVPKIIELIQTNSHLFKKQPIGPIGSCIKLNDPKWADPVEYLLRNQLGIFLCDSPEDRKVLDTICAEKQIQRKLQIITTKFTDKKFDISITQPPPGYTTIAHVLDIEDATVFNYIMDKASAELVVLFEEDDQARREMYPNPPVNALKALTLKCSEVNPARGRRPYQFFHNDFHSRLFSINSLSNNMADYEANMERIEKEIVENSSVMRKLKEAYNTTTKKLFDLRKKRDDLDVKFTRLNQQRYGLEEELHKLDDMMLSGDQISNIKRSIAQTEQERQACQRELDALRVKLMEISEKISEHTSKSEAAQSRVAHLKNAFNQIENQITSCGMQRERCQEELAKIGQTLQKLEQNEKKYRAELQQKKSEHEAKQQQAEQLSSATTLGRIAEAQNGPPNFEEIPETRELEKKMRAIEREIKLEEENREDPPTAQDLKKYEMEYIRFNKDVRIWQERCERIDKMIQNNNKRLKLLKVSLPQKLEQHFQECMNIRHYRGTLDVNDHENVINILVDTHNKGNDEDEEDGEEANPIRHSNRGRRNTLEAETSGRFSRDKRVMQDLKGLSGGERSYTTACFIMALWKCMESPFRCMDEFDVYMDMVNRRVIMEMLAEMAKENEEIQFIFFTPQPIHEMKREGFEVFQLKRIAGIFDEPDDEQMNEDGEAEM